MSSDLNLNVSTGGSSAGFEPEVTTHQPTIGGDAQTGGLTTLFDQAVDTLESSPTMQTTSTLAPDYTADATVPRLPLPTANNRGDNPFADATSLPTAGEGEFQVVANMFIPPGGTPEEGASAYQAFLAQYPPSSAEYKALLTLMNSPQGLSAETLTNARDTFVTAREQMWESTESADTARESTETEGVDVNGEEQSIFVTPEGHQSTDPDAGGGKEKSSSQDIQGANSPKMTGAEPAEVQGQGHEQGVDVAGEVAATTNVKATQATGDLTNLDISMAGITAALLTGKGNTAGIPQAHAQVLAIKDWVEKAAEFVNNLPESHEKASMMNYLRAISTAVQEFEQLLYALLTMDASKSREITAAKLEETLGKIEEARRAAHAQQKAAKKGSKKKKMGVMGKVLQGVAIATLLVGAAVMITLTPWTGGLSALAAAILITQAVDMCMQMGGQQGVWDKTFEGVDSVVRATGKSLGLSDNTISTLQTISKIVLASVVIATMVGTGAFLFGGTEVIKKMLQETLYKVGIFKNQWVQMGIGITLDVITMITQMAIAIGLMFVPGLQGLSVGMMVGSVTLMSAQAATWTIRAVSTVLTLMTVCISIVSMVDNANKIALAKIKMDLNKKLAKIEEDLQLRQALIELLKKLIKSLQDSMQSFSSTLATVQQGQNAMWKTLTAQMDQLYTA